MWFFWLKIHYNKVWVTNHVILLIFLITNQLKANTFENCHLVSIYAVEETGELQEKKLDSHDQGGN